MARTRDALKAIGQRSMNDEALVEQGKKTIRDVVAQALRSAGVENAVGFDLVLKNGENITISSDSNPVLDRPATDLRPGTAPQIRQAARAGLVQVFAIVG